MWFWNQTSNKQLDPMIMKPSETTVLNHQSIQFVVKKETVRDAPFQPEMSSRT